MKTHWFKKSHLMIILALFLAGGRATGAVQTQPQELPNTIPDTPWLGQMQTTPDNYSATFNENVEASFGNDAQNVEFVSHIGGATQVVAVQGDYAYLGEGPNLTILDISNPVSPTVVSKTLSGRVKDIHVAGDYAYVVVSGVGLRVLDISTPANPTEVGSYDIPGYARAVTVTEGHAYVVGYSLNPPDHQDWLRVIDVSDPANPTELALYETPLWSADVTVVEDYAYISVDRDLCVVDVSTPAHPAEVGCVNPNYEWGSAEHVDVAGDYAYVTTSPVAIGPGSYGRSSLVVVDISTPANPREIGSYEMARGANSVTVVEDIAYVAAEELVMVDISTPANPTEINSYDTPGWVYDLTVTGHRAYVADWDGLQVIDVSTPANPTLAGSYNTPVYASANDVAVAQGYAYLIDEDMGLRVVDVSTPANPTEVGAMIEQTWWWSVDVTEGYAYVTTRDTHSSLRVMDISTPSHPAELGLYSMPGLAYDVAVGGGTAYVAAGEGDLRVVDVLTPTQPTEISSYDIPGWVYDVAVAGDYAYVISEDYYSQDGGLWVLDVSTPSQPTELGFYDVPGLAYSLAVIGDYAYIVGSSGEFLNLDGWLRIVDISDPANPMEVGFYDLPGEAWDLTVVGNTVYVAAGSAGLRVLNVSTPSKPVELGFYDTSGEAFGVAVAGDYVYVAAQSGGLYTLRYTEPTFYVSGQVRDGADEPIPGVTISTRAGISATTNVSGVYTITDLLTGPYTLTPSLSDHSFWPTNRAVTLPPDAGSQNFRLLPAPVSTTLELSGTLNLPGSLSYVDAQGLTTTLRFPAGAVSTPTTLFLTPTLAQDSAGYAFAGHAFELAASQRGSLSLYLGFNKPVTVTLYYSEQDVRLISDESQLALWRWTGSGWEDAANTCTPPATGSLDLSALDLTGRVLKVPFCRSGLFGLFGPTRQAYLPLVLRSD